MPADPRRRFAIGLAMLAALALAARLVYSLAIVGSDPLVGDGLEFHLLANNLAAGHGFVQPFLFKDGVVQATADKPPLYPFLLAAFSLAGGSSWQWHQVAGALIGTGTVVVVGLLGRRVGGERAGLVAAGIAALYPMLVATDGSLRSESLYALAIALCLLTAHRAWERPTAGRAALLGAAIAAAALTRGEGLLLLGLLVVPVAWRAAAGARLRTGAVACVACLVVLAPWLARCWIVFDRPVVISTNVGGLLAGANCDKTYHGYWLGQWVFDCIPPPVDRNEALEAAHLRRVGIDYARDHTGRLPVVVAARVGRTWELFRPRQQANIERFFEGRDLRIEQAGVIAYYLLAALAIVGALLVRRRREPLYVLLSAPILVTIVSVIAYGFTRFRVAAEIPIVVLAAVALVALADRRASGRTT